ncbi:MAG: L,D-transpeptidase, partial [Microvirga sp.]
TYTYNPDYAFKGVKAKEKFVIKPGPNNPVGSTWIDLSVETFGIHGMPEPEKVGKAYSNGCVRLTNWDVEALAKMVKKGTPVEFLE